MAVTKRTRFEVFRRDDFQCQYCGTKGTDTGEGLTIDHVVPVALGGSDKPDNLVAACRDCNSGKSSIQPDAPIVTKLSAEASAYALGMLEKVTRLRAEVQVADTEYIALFKRAWDDWKSTSSGEVVPLPPDYEMSLFRWFTMGIPFRILEMAIPKAMTKPFLKGQFAEFTYFAGIVWKVFNDREIDLSVTEETVRIFTKYELEDYGLEMYDEGVRDGGELERLATRNQDFVGMVIDGRWDHSAMRAVMPNG